MVIRISSPNPTSVTNFFVTGRSRQKTVPAWTYRTGIAFQAVILGDPRLALLAKGPWSNIVLVSGICRGANDGVSYAARHLLNRQPDTCWGPPDRLQPVSFSRSGTYRLAPREKPQGKNGSAKHGKNQPHESVIGRGVPRTKRVQRIKKPDAMLGGEQRRRASEPACPEVYCCHSYATTGEAAIQLNF